MDEWHGTNAFIRDGDRVFRTYFVDSRGDEALGSVWSYLDITALGRQETWEDSPEGYPQTQTYEWQRWHDAYDGAGPSDEWRAQIDRGLSAMGRVREEPPGRGGEGGGGYRRPLRVRLTFSGWLAGLPTSVVPESDRQGTGSGESG